MLYSDWNVTLTQHSMTFEWKQPWGTLSEQLLLLFVLFAT